MAYARDNIERLAAYVPGEQPVSADVVKLNTNENPYSPPEGVLRAIAAVTPDQLRRYPPPAAPKFRAAAAKLHGLSPEHVIATNGGDELLRMAVTAFCGVGERGLGETQPTYSLYDVLADIHDTPVTRVPLNDDWSVPRDFAQKLNDAGCGLALIVNPHAPSGRLEPPDVLAQIANDFRGVLLIDEAYVDFARQSALALLRTHDNVLILRTLSKGYSLAGLRFGYGLGHPSLIATLDKVRDSYNTDALAQVAATAALEHADAAKANVAKVKAERDRLSQALSDLGYAVAPSDTNFLLATVPNAAGVYEKLKARSIFVRYFRQDRLIDKLRITVGTPAQNDKLIDALKNLKK